jgi:hypothetical protein
MHCAATMNGMNGRVGLSFKDNVSGRSLPLDKVKLRQAHSDTEHPLVHGCESRMRER